MKRVVFMRGVLHDWWNKKEEGPFVFIGNNLQLKRTQTESEIPLSVKYLQSVTTGI